MEPIITVIIPMYNEELYISKCLGSLLEQSYSKIEILIIDDGSTDQCYAISKVFEEKDSRIRVLHQENKGVSAARNLALKEAKGNYVVFVDADDYVSVDYVHTLWEVACREKCDLVISRYTTDNKSDVQHGSGCAQKIDSETAIINMLLSNKFDSSVCCKLVKTSLARKHQFRIELSIAEDLFFFYEIMNDCSEIAFVDKIDYVYVQNESGAINQLSNSKISSISIFEEMINNCNNNKIQEAIISKCISTCFHLLSLDRKNISDIEKVKYIIRKYRNRAIKDKHVVLKVKVACVISYFSFGLVKKLTSLKRG